MNLSSVQKKYSIFAPREETKEDLIKKDLEEMISEFGIHETWASIKKNNEIKKIFLMFFEKPKSYRYQRDPK